MEKMELMDVSDTLSLEEPLSPVNKEALKFDLLKAVMTAVQDVLTKNGNR